MKMRMKIDSDALKYLRCMIYPNKCIFCGEIMPPEKNICDTCFENLPWIHGEICGECGSLKEDCQCEKRHGSYYEGVASVFYYSDSVRDCIRRFKFQGEKYIYPELGNLMTECLRKRFSGIDFDYVTYVPIDKKRRRQRGYNQSELLARRISEKTGIPFGENLIKKIYRTHIQHECDMLERKGNLLGAFDIDPSFSVEGRTILLVDDIRTSGATLSECGKMLYLYGADKVFCLTAATVNSTIKKD